MKLNRGWILTQALNSILRSIMIGIVRRAKTDLTQMNSIWTKEESSGTVVGMMAKALTLIAYNMADKKKDWIYDMWW